MFEKEEEDDEEDMILQERGKRSVRALFRRMSNFGPSPTSSLSSLRHASDDAIGASSQNGKEREEKSIMVHQDVVMVEREGTDSGRSNKDDEQGDNASGGYDATSSAEPVGHLRWEHVHIILHMMLDNGC